MIKKILVGLDSTPFTETAIQHAVELAQLHKAALTGITVVNVKKLENVGPVPIGAGPYAKDLREFRVSETSQHAEEVIEKFESACRSAGINCQVKREKGNPLDLMVSHARYHDLIILGIRSVFDYGVVEEPGDMLCRLINESVRPIIAVGPQFRPIRRVLIAYDGSAESAAAMKQFVQLKLWPELTTQIVCFDKKTAEAEQLLSEAAAYCRSHGFKAEVQHKAGGDKQHLLRYAAEWNADLIVMGNSAKTLLTRRVFGDATIQTIQHSDRSLFLSQ